MSSQAKRLRFSVGDRVACNMGTKSWASGTVIALHYREEDWPPGKVAPYQVRLDRNYGGNLIFAPIDSPQVVRAATDAPAGTPSLPKSGGDATAAIDALHAELDQLRNLPFVVSVDPPRCMAVAESSGELITPTSSTGPFVVPLRIKGEPGSCYDSIYVVHAKCNTAWPRSPTELRICSVIHHSAVGEGGLVDHEELEAASERVQATAAGKGKKLGPLCTAVTALHQILHIENGLDNLNGDRLKVIQDYLPQRLHPDLFNAAQGWAREWFDPDFLASADAGTDESWRQLMREESWEVYSFPVFSTAFCEMFVEELYQFYASGLPARRPNSMNNYGVIINEIGLEPMLDRLQREYLQPISHALFPGMGSQFDHHHSFIVRYKVGEDLGLDMHTDDSDVTFNICLGKDFQGAGLQFCGNQASKNHRHASVIYRHVIGRCVVHPGHRRHGADDITAGERLNLIVWNHNSEYRETDTYNRFHVQGRHYEAEQGPPDPVCVSFTHDRDYGVFKEYTAKTMEHRGRGWCPPRFAEYEDFKAESKR